MTSEPGLASWFQLTLTPGLGAAAVRRLLQEFGLPENVLLRRRDELLRCMPSAALAALHSDEVSRAVTRALEWATEPGHSVITLADRGYPRLLLEIADPPPLLYARGRVELLDRPALAVVGSRNATAQGERNAESFARDAAKLPLRVIGTYIDISERKQAEETIQRQANFDPLTQLPNRRLFLDRLEQEIIKSRRADASLALFLVDLDQFKEVNDTLGHDVGDTLLQEAAQRIRGCTRDVDTVARLGGDEFTVILTELSGRSHVEDIAQKIINKLAEPFHLGNEVTYISASIGITLYPNDASDIDTLMKNADQAMYAAKKQGRNRFSHFTPLLQEAAQARLKLSKDLREAISDKQFTTHFQPIIDLATGHIHKAEALLRWQHPVRGQVNPMEFISLAEETGLINEIGDWVFKESARWAKDWSTQFGKDFRVSVNMSPVQFRMESRVNAEAWLSHFRELGFSGENLIVEITEGLLLNAHTDVIDKLFMFRDAGIQIAIDDFGTGYSSLSYLKQFPIDYLKIDRSFVRDLETDPNDMALSKAIIVMAHELGLRVVAEGVETEGQRNLLSAAGCDYAQGNLYAKPLPPAQFEAMLRNR